MQGSNDVPSVGSFPEQQLPPYTNTLAEMFFADQQPHMQGVPVYPTASQPPAEECPEALGDAKLKALRARNSAAQKRYQAKQKVLRCLLVVQPASHPRPQAKMSDLEARQVQLQQRLHDLQQEQAQLNKHAALLHSRLRGQEDELHKLLAELDIFGHGHSLPQFNGDYSRPQMCGVDIPLVVPPELIEQHKHVTYHTVMDHYARIVANMSEHLAELDTGRSNDAALAINNDVQELCTIFMAAAVHNPLHVKKMIAAVGMPISWAAIESAPPDLVAAMQPSVADLQLSKADVDHIMALRARCLRLLGASIVQRRQLVHALAFATSHHALQPAATPLRGGLQLSTTGCARGRALSILRIHDLATKLNAALLEGHVIVMQFVEDLYNKYLLPQPIVVARCCVKSFPYFPDDLSFATAVGVVHLRLDAAGKEISLSEETDSGVLKDTWSAPSGACMWHESKGEACVSMAAVETS